MSLKALHKKLVMGDILQRKNNTEDTYGDNYWCCDNQIVQAVWTLVPMCGLDDGNSFMALVSDFISRDGEACAHLLNVLAPEHGSATTLDTKDPTERANLILEHVERMDYKRYVTPKDIVEGSANLNLAFVAQIFQQRNGLSMDTKNVFF
ncbi:unnamed protein product [Camellia sinensis]